MLSETNDDRSKIIKYWRPRFARLQSLQTSALQSLLLWYSHSAGPHPNWFTGVLSKNILLNVWISTGVLLGVSKSALIVPWADHANFHLSLTDHCSSQPFHLYFKFNHSLAQLPLQNYNWRWHASILSCWSSKLDGVYEDSWQLCTYSEGINITSQSWGQIIHRSSIHLSI